MAEEVTNNLLTVDNLYKYFPIKKGLLSHTVGNVKAVDGLSFNVPKGKTMGVVGESGCGKTTMGRVILRLLEPTSGSVYLEGNNIYKLKKKDLRKLRRDMQIVFQDPFSSLSPRMTVSDIIGEPLMVHKIGDEKTRKERVKELLEVVGLSQSHINRYPHEFSGGQRQRIGVARALALNPKLIVLDEPVSALDVSIQSQIINLLEQLQEDYDLTYIFIAHDLAVVRHICEHVCVMYLGKIVESAPADKLFEMPKHPYTRALLSATPEADPDVLKEKILLKGDVPSPVDIPPGCRFHPRCPERFDICPEVNVDLLSVEADHQVACHLYDVKKS